MALRAKQRRHFHVFLASFCCRTGGQADRRGDPLGLAGRKILDKGAFHLALRGDRQDRTVLLALSMIL